MYLPALLCRRNSGNVGGLEMEDIEGAAIAGFKNGEGLVGAGRHHVAVNKDPEINCVQEAQEVKREEGRVAVEDSAKLRKRSWMMARKVAFEASGNIQQTSISSNQ